MAEENGDSGIKRVGSGAGALYGPTESAILYQSDASCPLGRLRLAGAIKNGSGVVPARPLRVYGSYAVVCIVGGHAGTYRDANGLNRRVSPGDMIFVFPELAHAYAPLRGHRWDEFYLTFDGPIFDLWRQAGLLDASHPVVAGRSLSATRDWVARLQALVTDGPRPQTPRARARQIHAFLTLLAERLPQTAPTDEDKREPAQGDSGAAWLTAARDLLETDLGRALDVAAVAAAIGMAYETFRKRFGEAVGMPPARYRTLRRIEAARELLRYTPQMTNRQVAETLGFADEYHFSKRFTQITGITPRRFRASLRG